MQQVRRASFPVGALAALIALASPMAPLTDAAAQARPDSPSAEANAVFAEARQHLLAGRLVEALMVGRRASELMPAQYYQPNHLIAQCYWRLGRLDAAFRESDVVLGKLDANQRRLAAVEDRRWAARVAQDLTVFRGEAYRLRADMRLQLGDYAGAQRETLLAVKAHRGNMMALLGAAQLALIAGAHDSAAQQARTWCAAVERFDFGDRQRRFLVENWRLWEAFLVLAEAEHAAGDGAAAARALQRMACLSWSAEAQALRSSFTVALAARAEGKDGLLRAWKAAQPLLAAERTGGQHAALAGYGLGVLFCRLGRFEEAVAQLERFPETHAWPAARLHLGLALLELGRVERAREALLPLARHDARVKRALMRRPDWPLLEAGMADLASRQGQRPEEQALRRDEQVLFDEVTRQVETDVRRYRFGRATRDLGRLGQLLGSGELVARLAERRAEVERLARVFDRVVARARAGGFAEQEVRLAGGAIEAAIESADPHGLIYHFRGGRARREWVYLEYTDFVALAEQVVEGAEERILLAGFLFDVERPREAERLLARVRRGAPAEGARVDRLFADRTGARIPAGGFVAYKGRLVSPDDRERMREGLVRWKGRWVSRADREHLRQGHEQVGGRWVPLTAAELTARGFRRHDGAWLSPEAYARVRGQWASAWVKETDHFTIRTNKSEAFADELARVAEAAYAELTRCLGKAPTRKLTLYAFASFDDYKAYCLKLDKPDMVGAQGFAPSEPGVCCGYDRFGDRRQFLGTMVHEATHLFWIEAFGTNLPSWLGEGMATYFEAFERRDGRWAFGVLNRNRLTFLKASIAAERLFSQRELEQASAIRLLQMDGPRALAFYAQAWGVFFYCRRTPAHRQAFDAFLKAWQRGEQPSLAESLGMSDDQLDRALRAFWKTL